MPAGFDVVVVGAGIVGLAHAWMAQRRGLSVLVIERTRVAQGASVRNFGMIWPIGQPAGELHNTALRSRELWLELQQAGAVQLATCGSIHLAHRDDEQAVLEEFCAQGSHDVSLLTADQVRQLSPLANPAGLRCGMLSQTEMRVDPRQASRSIAQWLAATCGVNFEFGTTVCTVADGTVQTTDGRQWQAEKIIVCGGSDLQTLFPEYLQQAGLKLCKLQMLAVPPQQNLSPDSAHIASGLTLRHYQSFESCPGHAQLRARIASETPELDRYGIHVMASVMPDQRIILGDSHVYDAEITPFDSAQIDELILRELRKVIQLQNWQIAERWHGIYARHPQQPVVAIEVSPGIQLCTGTGGAGMTMSFGLADRLWNQWQGTAS